MEQTRETAPQVTPVEAQFERIFARSLGDETDWFALRALAASREIASTAHREAARRQLCAALAGTTSEYDGSIQMILRIGPSVEIDATTARLMAAKGIRPSAAAAMASLNYGQLMLTVSADPTPRVRLATGPPPGHAQCRNWVELPSGEKWQSGGMLRLRSSLPEAVMAAAPGMLLASVVSHPAIDPDGHVIRKAWTHPGGKAVIGVETDRVRFAALGFNDMERLWANRDRYLSFHKGSGTHSIVRHSTVRQ